VKQFKVIKHGLSSKICKTENKHRQRNYNCTTGTWLGTGKQIYGLVKPSCEHSTFPLPTWDRGVTTIKTKGLSLVIGEWMKSL
jgi:hypothetical protein